MDLHDAHNKVTLNKAMTEFMRNDKAKHTILPLNKFCLMQITRQRVRQATIIETTEQCPTCKGTGKIKPPILIEDELDNTLEFLFDKQQESKITIMVHPFVYAHLKHGFPSILLKWRWKYKKRIRLVANQSYSLFEHGSGGTPVTSRGVCWSTTPNPTVSNGHTFDGDGTGGYTSGIAGLAPGTTYYIRAYAVVR